MNLGVRWRAAQAHDVGKETRVLRQARRKQQVGRSELVGVPGGLSRIACRLSRELRDARSTHAHRDFLALLVGERLFELLAEPLSAVDPFPPVGHGLSCPLDRRVVFVAVLVDVDLNPPDARLGFRQDGAGFELAQALLEHLDAIEKRLRVGRASRRIRPTRWFSAWNVERLEGDG